MKKSIILFLIILFNLNLSYAINPADWLKKIPDNFTPECYEYYNKIDKFEVRNNSTNEKYKTYKIDLNQTEDLVITQFWFILPYKYYSSLENSYKYEDNLWIASKYLTDFNFNTYKEINSKSENEIILEFDNYLEKNNFSFTFNYKTNNYSPIFYISNDGKSWDLLKKEDIENFSFKYLKIEFNSKTKESFLENIKIYELNFTKKSNTILIKSVYNDDVEIYSKYNCKDKYFSTKYLDYNLFTIDNNTKTIELKSEINPKYNVYTKKDYDNDWVEDNIDNCKTRYNPNQNDINWDGTWDVCSDDDNDWILWYYDNCIQIYNPDQKDINRNNVWDICEFDKDKDWVFDSLDNCINTPNPNQLDKDRDGIWDMCDNCKTYNPRQLDINNNSIWDVCEKEDEYLKENDDDNDSIINYKDNCKDTYNKDQLDSDKDNIWDVCDNCTNIQNQDQLDFNKNWIWDICEDSDNDWIEWLIDNCINIANPEQLDSDNDWVWDLCEDDDRDNIVFQNDNCPYIYNIDQMDIDKDGIWDKCDETDNRYIESNSNFFISLIIFITLAFFFWTYLMVRKLK